jgi:LacI family transcriptional regulator
MNAIQHIGKQIPDDISVVGYDDIPMAATSQHALTTINLQPVELGRSAADLMLKRLNGAKPANVVISPILVKRESLKIMP